MGLRQDSAILDNHQLVGDVRRLPRHSLTYASAVHCCEQFPTPEACCEWLKNAPQAVNFAPKFCPNIDIFFELKFDQQGGPRSPEVKRPPGQT
jgi:hypothetical protein